MKGHSDHLDPDLHDNPPQAAMIANLDDLAAHVGANEATPASINRRVYKDTPCGPWVSFYFETAPAYVTKHLAEVRKSKTGPGLCLKLTPFDKTAAEFLGFDDGKTAPADLFPTLEAFRKACDTFAPGPNQKETMESVTKCIGCVRVRLTIKHPVQWIGVHNGQTLPEGLDLSTCYAVQVGSIVEGSDAEITGDTMRFPFPADHWDRCLEYVNSEANAAWEEANSQN